MKKKSVRKEVNSKKSKWKRLEMIIVSVPRLEMFERLDPKSEVISKCRNKNNYYKDYYVQNLKLFEEGGLVKLDGEKIVLTSKGLKLQKMLKKIE